MGRRMSFVDLPHGEAVREAAQDGMGFWGWDGRAEALPYLRSKSKSKGKYGDSGFARMTLRVKGRGKGRGRGGGGGGG